MTFEHRNGLSIGAVENFSPQHHLIHDNSRPHGVARLSVELEWTNPAVKAIMRSSIVRGEPYVKMEVTTFSFP